MTKRTRAAATLAAVLGLTTLVAPAAQAKSCPSTPTVTTTSTYTYERGCIRSFDSTPIVYNLFEPLKPAAGSLYTILEGPGWGGAGSTAPDANLIKAGYAEMTWDPRGFGQSGGVAEVDSPAAEGRDVSALIDQVLTGRPEFVTDRHGRNGQPRYTNDGRRSNSYGRPVVGMTGYSYGGGIEWSTAAFDNRVKAIAPGWAWNDLDYSLDPGGVIKLGWGELLYGVGLGEGGASHLQGNAQGAPSGGTAGNTTGGYDPMIHYAETTGGALGYWDNTSLAWFHQRSLAEYGAGPAGHVPNVPTLMIQGTVDTLFNLTDAWNSYVEIKGHHPKLPLDMIAYCSGHVSCPTGASPTGNGYSDTASKTSPVGAGLSAGAFAEQQTIAWFDHYLRGQNATDGMPADVVYQDQNGNFYPTATFPTPADPDSASFATAKFNATLVDHNAPTGAGPLGASAAETDGATNANDPGQATIPVITNAAHATPIVGIGHVNATVTVNGAATNLFFRLIDKNTGDVVDLQTSPLRLDNLDLVDNGTNAGAPQAIPVSLDLAGVAYTLPKGDELDLQVSTSTDSFVPNRGAAVVQIAGGTVSVPTLTPQR